MPARKTIGFLFKFGALLLALAAGVWFLIGVNYIDRNDNYIDRRSGVNNQHHPVSLF
jgi:hypothetical protein